MSEEEGGFLRAHFSFFHFLHPLPRNQNTRPAALLTRSTTPTHPQTTNARAHPRHQADAKPETGKGAAKGASGSGGGDKGAAAVPAENTKDGKEG